ncbi:MAG TPA: CDP-diacylglycerol--serine O-phosphatidyltransferase [Candidatus Binataceae bacterium]|nr:CDP-diacylglycerol--serine O-phosphatidyltransferase [Candidatus Binataceae bacterium]
MSRIRGQGRAPQARMRLISGRINEQRKRVVAPLRRGVFLAPATITSLGLLSGFFSLVSAINSHFELAAVMIFIAFICDGLDGRVARLSRTSSAFGVEYDSLSDVVAFGVAPAGVAYCWSLKLLGAWGVVIAGVYVICAALRLARFNVQTASVDKRRFVGLPVPGAAVMIAGLVLAYSYFEFNSPHALCTLMAPLTAALAGLMISRVPYPSFKGLNLRQRAPVELMVAMLVALAFLFAMPQFTAFVLATAYVASGPYLLMRGERIQTAAAASQPAADGHAAPAPPPQPSPRRARSASRSTRATGDLSEHALPPNGR